MDMITALKNVNFLYKLYKAVPTTKIKNIIETPFRHAKLSDEYFQRELEAGDIVTVSGYLSKYCQYFKPTSYAPGVYKPSIEETKMSFDRFGNNPVLRTSLEMGLAPAKKAVVPLQALPMFGEGSASYLIAFLYPDDFTGFLEVGGVYTDAKITESHKAIPVLLNEKDFSRLTEKKVKLTAKLHPLPQDAVNAFSNTFVDNDVQKMMYLHFRPTSELVGFAIDARETLEVSTEKMETRIKAGVYVEGHFEAGPTDMHRFDFGNLVDGVTASTTNRKDNGNVSQRVYGREPDIPVYWDNIEKGFIRYYLRNDRVKIMQYNSTISFYTEFSLLDDRDAYENQTRLKTVYNGTWRSIKKYFSANGQPDATFELDFVWDYRKAGMFHNKGFLRSSESEKIFRTDEGLNNAKQWLKG